MLSHKINLFYLLLKGFKFFRISPEKLSENMLRPARIKKRDASVLIKQHLPEQV